MIHEYVEMSTCIECQQDQDEETRPHVDACGSGAAQAATDVQSVVTPALRTRTPTFNSLIAVVIGL